MKRGIILVLTILLSMGVSNAQSLNVFGTDISFFTLFPIVLILLVLIFFLGLFIKDALTSKKKEVKVEKEDSRSEEKPKKEEKKEPEKKDKKEILRILFTKVKDFETKISSLNPKESLSQLDVISKEFFKEKYSISKEFSLSELDGLVSITKEEKKICNEVEILKFSGEEEAKTEKIKRLTISLSGLIKEFYYKTRDQKEIPSKLVFLVKIKDFLIKHLKREEKQIETKEGVLLVQKEIPLTPIPKEVEEKKSFEIHPPKFFYYTKRLKILRELNDGIRIAKENNEEAKKIYGKSLIEYYKLPVTEEEKITGKLTELYSKIKDDEIHKKEKIGEKTKEIIKIKKEGHKREKEAKRILDSIERWITEISIKEEIKNEYKSVILGIRRKIIAAGLSIHNFERKETKKVSSSISDFIKNTKSSISRFESKEVNKLSEIISETSLELSKSKERITHSIENNFNKRSMQIRKFEDEEQKKVHNLIRKLENIKEIKEKIEKKRLGVPEIKDIVKESKNQLQISKAELIEAKIPELKLQYKKDTEEQPKPKERWYKGILNINRFNLPEIGKQKVKHPTEREVYLFKHKINLPEDREIVQHEKVNQINKESLVKLSKEEEKIMQKIDKMEEQRVTRTEIENLKIRYRNQAKMPIFSHEKSRLEKERINQLEREKEELRNKLSSLY